MISSGEYKIPACQAALLMIYDGFDSRYPLQILSRRNACSLRFIGLLYAFSGLNYT